MATTRSVPSDYRRAMKTTGWGIMFLLALLMFLVASSYLTQDPEAYFAVQRAVYVAHPAGILIHVAGAMLATIIGPFQFLPRILIGRYLNLHRWLGRVYLVGILVGGLGGLYMAPLAYGGFPARLGFALLAACWLVSGFLAYRHIRNKDVQKHRQWMVRSYALTFAAVTLRLWLILFQVAGVEFVEAYIAVAWLSWVPNLIVAEWIVDRIRLNQPGSVAA